MQTNGKTQTQQKIKAPTIQSSIQKSLDPNCYARLRSEQIWNTFLSNSRTVSTWILVCNFFFGFFPGLLFFVSNVRLSQEQTQSLPQLLPSFNRMVNWFGILFVLFPICISIFQIFQFNRFISLRMTRTFFIGQSIGFIFYMLSFSEKVLEKFQWLPSQFTFFGLTLILVTITMILFFIPYLFSFSELVWIGQSPCGRQQMLQ